MFHPCFERGGIGFEVLRRPWLPRQTALKVRGRFLWCNFSFLALQVASLSVAYDGKHVEPCLAVCFADLRWAYEVSG